MSTRPTKLPRWATVPTVDPTYGVTNVVEPTEPRKDAGWLVEKPAGNIQNWFMNLTYQWLAYLDSVGMPFAIATTDTTNNYLLDFDDVFTTLDNNTRFFCQFDSLNDGPVTLDVDTIGSVALVDNGQGNALSGGEIVVGTVYIISYSESTSNLRILDSISATDAMALAGVSKTTRVTPKDLALVAHSGAYLYASTAGTDTYAATLTPTLVASRLVVGSEFHILFANANTAASPTLNINGTGTKIIKSFNSTTLNAGDIVSNSMITLVYDGSEYRIKSMITDTSGIPSLAGISTNIAVTPFSMKNHPGVSKARINFDGTGTISITEGYNITSITDLGIGLYKVNLAITMASSTYTVNVTTTDDTAASVYDMTTTSFSVRVMYTTDGTNTDTNIIMCTVNGDLA